MQPMLNNNERRQKKKSVRIKCQKDQGIQSEVFWELINIGLRMSNILVGPGHTACLLPSYSVTEVRNCVPEFYLGNLNLISADKGQTV